MKTYGRVRFSVAALMRAADASPTAAGTDGDVVLGADHFGATARTAIIANLADTEVAGFFNDAHGRSRVRERGTVMTRIRMARIAMTLALMAAVLVQAGVAEGAPSLWSITPSPNQKSSGFLNGVSCTSSTRCVAVGHYVNGAGATNQTLIETWNGTSWSVTPTPNPGGTGNVLTGVSCTSSTRCVAVGHYVNGAGPYQTLIEIWNGTSWSVTPSPSPGIGANVLNGVSCTSSTRCAAVGYYQPYGGPYSGLLDQSLVETWNGTSWSVTLSPNQGASNHNFLNGVSCTSSTRCVGVGYYVNGAGLDQTLVETWNGTSWSITPTPNPGDTGNVLTGVSCTSSTSCVGVGSYHNNTDLTLVETWNGTSWSVTPSPNNGTSTSFLQGVSCTSPTRCMAVGWFDGSSGHKTLIETWNGTSWSVTPSPNPGGNNVLSGVSCTTSTSCAAVGDYFSASMGRYVTLVETWNGTSWSVTPSPSPGASYNYLNSVSCTTSTSCVAVGYHLPGYIETTLIETWNGTSWSATASPNPSSYDNVLSGVSCTSSTRCVAVGAYINGSGPYQTLVETWNGTNWSVTPSPNQGTNSNFLNSVSCTTSTSCVAVGYIDSPSGTDSDHTLVETWNGTSWSITPSPNPGLYNNVFNSVSCTSSTRCMAVGWFDGSSGHKTLIETWNGTSWSVTPSPNPGGNNVLSGVSCTTSTSCAAVGGYVIPFGPPNQTLVETWNGTSWSVTPSPNPGPYNSLSGVSCTTSTSCAAVGNYQNGSGIDRTLVEAWNGTTWSITPSPNRGTSNNNFFSGVSCTSSTSCAAVGYYHKASGPDQTLVETGS